MKVYKSFFTWLFFISSVILVSLAGVVFSQNQGDKKEESKKRADQLYREYKSSVNSAGGVRQKFVNPLLGNTPLTTINGTVVKGNAQILCPSSNEYMSIIGQPTSTGDVNFIINLPGKQVIINGVSGICANGYFICKPGQWNNCTPYLIEYDNVTNTLVSKPVSSHLLSSCFCINNDCGNNLFVRNYQYVLSVFGGAVARAVQEKNPGFTVSGAVIDGFAIKFYGQNYVQCYDPATGVGKVQELKNYFENPHEILNQATTQYYSEINNPKSNSTARLVYERYITMDDTAEFKECTIKRYVTQRNYNLQDLFSRASDCEGSLPGPFPCGLDCVYFSFAVYQAVGSDSGYASVDFEMTPDFYSIISDIKAVFHTDTGALPPCFDDDSRFYFYLNGKLAAYLKCRDCETDDRRHRACLGGIGVVHVLPLDKGLLLPPPDRYTSIINNFSVTVTGGYGKAGVETGCRPMKLYFYLSKPFKGCYINQDRIENGCAVFENDTSCKLWYEEKNGVVIVDSGYVTGLKPVVECRLFCDEYVCTDSWEVKRIYRCDRASTYNLENATKRMEYVMNSTNYSEGRLTFDDIRNINGTWMEFPNQQMYVDAGEQPDECMPVCRVISNSTLREVETDLSMRGKVVRRDEYIYKPCLLNPDRSYSCPLSQGETIDVDCTCASRFNEAAAALQALRIAGQDYICTSGVEKDF